MRNDVHDSATHTCRRFSLRIHVDILKCRHVDRSALHCPPAAEHRVKLMMKRLVLALLAAILVGGCATSMRADPPRPARISHIVLFKLHDPADAPELIGDCVRMLPRIPGVVTGAAGRPLDTARGDRVDGNYDVGLYIGFSSEQDYARFVEHPDHLSMVKKWTPRLEWLRIHDVLNDTP
jgi:hypothetical protein